MSTAKKKKIKPRSKGHLNLVKTDPSSAIRGLVESQIPENTETFDDQELARLGDTLDPSDPNFQSELNYDGYQTIEESDNDSYSSLDAERNENTPREVKIKDREADPESGEEDLIDPQDNRK
jgi:hypothetical protein